MDELELDPDDLDVETLQTRPPAQIGRLGPYAEPITRACPPPTEPGI
jgi:hypothetical protein